MHEKQQLRAFYKQKLETLSPSEYREKSDIIIEKLCMTAEYQQAKTIFCYIATTLEVDTSGLIERISAAGKTLIVPRIEGDTIIPKQISNPSELVPGPFDILQPGADSPTVSTNDLNIVIVPGLAFTESGVRLGRGGGYFDRWLPSLSAHVPIIGLAFDFQIAGDLPQEPHDVVVGTVISA